MRTVTQDDAEVSMHGEIVYIFTKYALCGHGTITLIAHKDATLSLMVNAL
jgi:hypothetical protein